MNPNAHISVAGLTWVSASGGNVPHGAVEGGHRGGHREPLYVALVQAPDGKLHPAKVAKSAGHHAHYHYQSAEKVSKEYFALVCDPNIVTLKWVHARNGKIPAYAVQGERGELYIGRHEQSGELVVGEVNPVERACIIVTGLNAYRFSEYEVLCAIPHVSTAAN